MVQKEPEAEEESPEEPAQKWAALKRILTTTRPEWCYIFIAAISSLVIGASFPGFSILFGEFYGVCIKYPVLNTLTQLNQINCLFLGSISD